MDIRQGKNNFIAEGYSIGEVNTDITLSGKGTDYSPLSLGKVPGTNLSLKNIEIAFDTFKVSDVVEFVNPSTVGDADVLEVYNNHVYYIDGDNGFLRKVNIQTFEVSDDEYDLSSMSAGNSITLDKATGTLYMTRADSVNNYLEIISFDANDLVSGPTVVYTSDPLDQYVYYSAILFDKGFIYTVLYSDDGLTWPSYFLKIDVSEGTESRQLLSDQQLSARRIVKGVAGGTEYIGALTGQHFQLVDSDLNIITEASVELDLLSGGGIPLEFESALIFNSQNRKFLLADYNATAVVITYDPQSDEFEVITPSQKQYENNSFSTSLIQTKNYIVSIGEGSHDAVAYYQYWVYDANTLEFLGEIKDFEIFDVQSWATIPGTDSLVVWGINRYTGQNVMAKLEIKSKLIV